MPTCPLYPSCPAHSRRVGAFVSDVGRLASGRLGSLTPWVQGLLPSLIHGGWGVRVPTPPSLSTPSPHIIKAFPRPRAVLILLPHLPSLSVLVHWGPPTSPPAAIHMT